MSKETWGLLEDVQEEVILQKDDLYLVVHVLQPLQSQVGNNKRRAVVNRQNINLEFLRSRCYYLENEEFWHLISSKISSMEEIIFMENFLNKQKTIFLLKAQFKKKNTFSHIGFYWSRV